MESRQMTSDRKINALKVNRGGGSGRFMSKTTVSVSKGVTATEASIQAQTQEFSTIQQGNVAQSRGISQSSTDSGIYVSVGVGPPADLRDSETFTSSKSHNRRDAPGRVNSAGRPDSSGYISGSSVASTPDRPASALARGIIVREQEGKTNPDPFVLEDTDLLIDDYLSPRRLVRTDLFGSFTLFLKPLRFWLLSHLVIHAFSILVLPFGMVCWFVTFSKHWRLKKTCKEWSIWNWKSTHETQHLETSAHIFQAWRSWNSPTPWSRASGQLRDTSPLGIHLLQTGTRMHVVPTVQSSQIIIIIIIIIIK